ncbi:MAG: hypothetical protein ACKO3K_09980 [Cuspidothrix sp.]
MNIIIALPRVTVILLQPIVDAVAPPPLIGKPAKTSLDQLYL